MKQIEVDYCVVRGGETILEGYSPVKLTDKNVKEVEAYIRDGHFSGELMDIPSHVFDRIFASVVDVAIQDLKKELKEDLYDTDEVQMQEVLPMTLVNLLSPDVIKVINMANILAYYDLLEEDEPEGPFLVEDEVSDMPFAYDAETKYWKILGEEEPNESNSLYLTIKQTFFDEIIAGTKKIESREVKDTTYKKYLACDDEGYPIAMKSLIANPDDFDYDILDWNDGVCPYYPKENLRYLNLAVGYNKERDTATVELDGFSFSPQKTKDGQVGRLAEKDGHLVLDPDGPFCLWLFEMHIKRIVDFHRKS